MDDTFEVDNTADGGLVTDLEGGTGTNVFDIVHGGLNQDIDVTGGLGSNVLVLDRTQTSASVPG